MGIAIFDGLYHQVLMDINNKPPIFDGWNPTHKNGDGWEMVQMTLLYPHYHQFPGQRPWTVSAIDVSAVPGQPANDHSEVQPGFTGTDQWGQRATHSTRQYGSGQEGRALQGSTSKWEGI